MQQLNTFRYLHLIVLITHCFVCYLYYSRFMKWNCVHKTYHTHKRWTIFLKLTFLNLFLSKDVVVISERRFLAKKPYPWPEMLWFPHKPDSDGPLSQQSTNLNVISWPLIQFVQIKQISSVETRRRRPVPSYTVTDTVLHDKHAISGQ